MSSLEKGAQLLVSQCIYVLILSVNLILEGCLAMAAVLECLSAFHFVRSFDAAA